MAKKDKPNDKQYLVVFHDAYLDGGLLILVVNHVDSEKDAIDKAFAYKPKDVKQYDYVCVDEIDQEHSVIEWMAKSQNEADAWQRPNPYYVRGS